MVVDLNCSLNNDFHSLYIHFHRLFDLSDNLCCHRDSDGKQNTQVAYWLAHIIIVIIIAIIIIIIVIIAIIITIVINNKYF